MADFADVAAELEQAERDDAIRRARAAAVAGPSETWCVDCDGVIPHARRALGGIRRCVECQDVFERRKGRGAR